MNLGEFILAVRTDRGFSQAELAERSGGQVSSAEISRIESGKRRTPTPKALKALAAALNVSYTQLMELAGYAEEIREEEQTFEKVFRNEETGEIVEVIRGVKEMYQTDATWANVAYRVSHNLNDDDRKFLTQIAEAYLEKRRREMNPEKNEK